MPQIPTAYPPEQDKAIASYDFFDLLTGTSYKVLYAGKSTITVGYLRSFVFDSYNVVGDSAEANNGVYTEWTNEAGGTYVKKIDQDFDVKIGNTTILEGEAIATGTCFFANTSSNWDYDVYVTIRIRHWDGTTETEIANGTSKVFKSDNTVPQNTDIEIRWNANIDIPITSYKKGETLRMTLEVWNRGTTAATTCSVSHDPANKLTTDRAEVDSTLKLFMPFRTIN